MEELKPQYDEYAFKTRRGWPNSGSGGVTDWTGIIGGRGFNGEYLVEFRAGTFGVYPASEVPGTPDIFDQNVPTSVYIHGTENYDGLRRIYNLRSGRLVQIYAPYVAESPSGHTYRCGYKAEVPCEFGGFSVVGTLLSPIGPWYSGTCEITIYSAKGAAFDNKIFSRNLIHRTKVEHMFKPPRYLAPGDRLDLAIGGGGTTTTKLYIRKLA